MRRGNKYNGVITVFLSLILCAVLTVVGTGVELSRLEMGKSIAARAVHIGLESLLGEYSLEIFRRYHLFLLNSSFGGKEEREDLLISHIKEDIENTFSPNRNINQWNPLKLRSMDILGLKLHDLSITQKKSILEEDGELFVNEVVAYMKYAIKPEEVDELIKKLSPFSELKGSAAIVGESMKAEQKMAELDRSLMDFIELVEGLTVKKKQFHFQQNGLLETEDYFVKALCPGQITMENMGVQNSLIWNSLKSKYSNPMQMLTSIKKNMDTMEKDKMKIENLQLEIEKLREVSAESEEEAERLMQRIEAVYDKMNDVEKRQKKTRKSMNESFSQIKKLLQNVKQKNINAIEMLPKILHEQNNYALVLSDYESKLNSYKETSDKELYDRLAQELEDKKAYANGGIPCLSGKTMEEIETILKQNLQVIEEAEQEISEFAPSISVEDANVAAARIADLSQIFERYDTKSFVFSYGEITENKPENPIDSIKTLLKEGILELIIEDTASLSKKVLSSQSLVSSVAEDISNIESNHDEKNEFPNIDFDFFSSFSDLKDDIVRTALIGSYFAEHFQMAVNCLRDSMEEDEEVTTEEVTTEEVTTEEVHALDYEIEYLLAGKMEDRDNLLASVNRILLVRTVCNFIYLYTNGEASGKANATATALVGFTCFSPLISLTKTLILIAWSYAEGLVDVAALLQGYSIPLLKNDANFTMKYEELIGVNKNKIQEKAEKWKDIKTGIKYEEYMQFLLLLVSQKTKCYRALDLIQENINLSGKEYIDMRNAIFGIGIRGECSVSVKFLKLPFINKLVAAKQNQYSFIVETEAAY